MKIQREPDEKLLRNLEEYAKISESDVFRWRLAVLQQLLMLRMDLCLEKLREAFAWFITTPDGVECLNEYPTIFPAVGKIVLGA